MVSVAATIEAELFGLVSAITVSAFRAWGDALDESGWIAGHYCIGGHIFSHHTGCSHYGIVAYCDSGQYGGPGSNPGVMTNAGGLAGYDMTFVKVMVVRYELHIGRYHCSVGYGDSTGRHLQAPWHYHYISAYADHVGPDGGEGSAYSAPIANGGKYAVHQFAILGCAGHGVIEPEYELCLLISKRKFLSALLRNVDSCFSYDSCHIDVTSVGPIMSHVPYWNDRSF